MISICMAYYDRQERLNDALMKYDELYSDLDLEIIIVDDGSPETVEVRTSFPYTVLHLPKKSGPKNPCLPFHMAILQANSDRVLLTSPEVVHRTPVIENMVRAWDSKFDFVQASVFDHARGYLTGPTSGKGGRGPMPENAYPPNCALFSKELYVSSGGYDLDYRNGRGWDDNDFLWRMYYAGARFKLIDDVVYHVHENTKWNMPSNEKLFFEKWPDLRSS